jgi:hypothetical protein
MNPQSAYLEGFQRGLRGEPLLTPGQGNETVPMKIPANELRKLSTCYQCSTKTLRRLLHRGVDVTDASAVACQLAGQKTISHPMAQAVLAQLQIIES